MPESSTPTIRYNSDLYSSGDFTYFVKIREAGGSLDSFFSQYPEYNPGNITDFIRNWDGWEGRLRLKGKATSVEGRAIVAKCYDGDYLSITIRRDKGPKDSSEEKLLKDFRPRKHLKLPTTEKEAFCLDDDRNAMPFKKLAKTLFETVFRNTDSLPTGLVVVCGATKSGKSVLTRSLIRDYLANYTVQADDERRPHFVTLEDPIEKYFAVSKNPKAAQKWGIDYTPRRLGRVRPTSEAHADGWKLEVQDCQSLKEGLRNALRMTPSVFYIGETRDVEDWQEVIKFAGTGHLVFTTAHASSLTETIKSILNAVKARTPADRGDVAERILAAVHLKTLPIRAKWDGENDSSLNVLLPQVWRRTALSVASLVADGLSSVHPARPASSNSEEACLSRAWFAQKLFSDSAHSKLLPEISLQTLTDEISTL